MVIYCRFYSTFKAVGAVRAVVEAGGAYSGVEFAVFGDCFVQALDPALARVDCAYSDRKLRENINKENVGQDYRKWQLIEYQFHVERLNEHSLEDCLGRQRATTIYILGRFLSEASQDFDPNTLSKVPTKAWHESCLVQGSEHLHSSFSERKIVPMATTLFSGL